jgi:chromosome segregation ATPase
MDDMSDTFWVQIGLIAMFVAKALLDEWRLTRRREYDLRIAAELHANREELHANTEATNKGNEEVVSKIESGTREMTEHAVEAKNAASTAAQKAGAIEEKAKAIETTANKIEERLNGGDAGLGARIAKNETRLDSLEKGQETITRSVDQLVISFANFARRFDKSHPSETQVGHTQVNNEV